MAKRYNNFFLEEEPPKKAITPEQITLEQPVVQPEVTPAATPLLTKPTTTKTPEDYKLGDKFNETYNPPAIKSTNPQLAPAVTGETTEKKPYYKTVDEIRADVEKGWNPISAMMAANTPVLDEKKQARLQRIAAVNSIGKGLGTVLQGFYGKKGATITPDTSTLLPETYKEYTSDLDNYQAKKDLWNKDMMALELKKNDEVNRRVDNNDNKRFQVEQYDKQIANQLAAEQRQRDFQTKQSELDKEFQLKIFNAKSAADQEQFRQQLKQRKDEMYAGFAHDESMLDARITAAEQKAKADAETARLKAGIVSRQPGTEAYPFGFRNSKGQSVAIDADQLTIVEDLMTREEGDGMSYESMVNGKRFEAMRKDSKISESEAREILNKYFDKYYTLENGKAVFKGGAGEVDGSKWNKFKRQ